MQNDKITTPGIQEITGIASCVILTEKNIFVNTFKGIMVKDMKAAEKRIGRKPVRTVEPATIADVADIKVKVRGIKENLESAETLLTLLKVFQ